MTRTMAVFICFLLTQTLVVLETEAWLNNPGKIRCQSFSGPALRTVSQSSSQPFLNFKSFLNAYNTEPPLKPCIGAIYIPEPFEVTEKSSVILHKQYGGHADTDDDEEDIEHNFYYNPVGSSEEYSSKECEVNYKEITFREDIYEEEDNSDEDEDDTVKDEDDNNEEITQNYSIPDDCDHLIVTLLL
ncbi:myelin transcription factor 1-like protein [Vanessa atalanta]|uniref:myelin transcription factor 1-like protein n=1 Tax=Vanessa atalanta TaxID=42275 RepID=UPI001FCE2EE2|nr:myelin transcription factor 1-like protein [Vanessa atalanta]